MLILAGTVCSLESTKQLATNVSLFKSLRKHLYGKKTICKSQNLENSFKHVTCHQIITKLDLHIQCIYSKLSQFQYRNSRTTFRNDTA